ncbi:PspC domain-containing protein [Nocardioides stalactiti]|uniref:PspC domain-containing protein n=1 Tax=Nocardioides stalactiti TaxID=2755356 RepID=UPI001600E085|nr:PspC domain-containing protein [Nocardioides stalactiti]
MTTTPPEAPSGHEAPPPGAAEPVSSGPRVTREEAKDLGRIRRSLSDRKIAGVAGGIARHFDIDPLLVRVALVLLVFFGGGGILAYVAGWLLIPEDGSDEATIRVDHRTRTVLLAIVGAVCALSLVGDSFGGWSFPWPLAIVGLVIAAVISGTRPKPHPGPLPSSGWIPAGTTGEVPGSSSAAATTSTYRGYEPPTPSPYRPRPSDPRRRGPVLFWFTMGLAAVLVSLVATLDLAGWDAPPSAYPAAVLAACGVMLVVGSVFGRAGGLIFVGLVAALATLAASAVEDISAGQVDAQPTTAEQVDDRYYVGAGEVILDLTDLSPAELEELDGRTIELEARFGHVLVLVPEEGLDVNVQSNVEAGGESVVFGERTDGSLTGWHDGGTDTRIDLDLTVLFGQIEVETKEAA